jgi:hypothetical protein
VLDEKPRGAPASFRFVDATIGGKDSVSGGGVVASRWSTISVLPTELLPYAPGSADDQAETSGFAAALRVPFHEKEAPVAPLLPGDQEPLRWPERYAIEDAGAAAWLPRHRGYPDIDVEPAAPERHDLDGDWPLGLGDDGALGHDLVPHGVC